MMSDNRIRNSCRKARIKKKKTNKYFEFSKTWADARRLGHVDNPMRIVVAWG